MIPGLSFSPIKVEGLGKDPIGQPLSDSKSLNFNDIKGFSLDEKLLPDLPNLEAIPLFLTLNTADIAQFEGLKLPPEFAAKLQELLANPRFTSHLNLQAGQLQQLQNQLRSATGFADSQLSLSSLELLAQGFTKLSEPEMTASLSQSDRDLFKSISQEFVKLFDQQGYKNSTDLMAAQLSNRLFSNNGLVLDSVPKLDSQSTQITPTAIGNQLLSTQSIMSYQPSVRVDTYLAQPQWQEAFNSKVMLLAQDQRQLAHIQIKPPELGPVEIRMAIVADQTHIQFISQHGVVREAIEDSFPRLREMMHDSGINLGDVNVSDQSAASKQDSDGENSLDVHNNSADENEQTAMIASPRQQQLGLIDQYV